MSDSIDPRVVEAACMADLSRHRQEELPLSNKETKGPSFAPSGRNGTDHISGATKKKLLSKWGNIEIDDEEARQVEGLKNEDARPWAKKFTAGLLHSGRIIFDLPPKPTQRAPPPSVFEASTKSSSKSSSKPSSKPTSKTKKTPENHAMLTIRKTLWGQAEVNKKKPQATDKKKAEVSVPSNKQPSISEKKPTPVQVIKQPTEPELVLRTGAQADLGANVLFAGTASMAPGKQGGYAFIAEFKAIFDGDNNRARLGLTARGKGTRIIDVLDLKDPTIEDPFCVIEEGQVTHYLKLADLKSTTEFKDLLSKLRQAAEFHVNNPSAEANDEIVAAAPAEVAPIDETISVTPQQTATTMATDASEVVDTTEPTDISTATQNDELALVNVSQNDPLIELDGFKNVSNPSFDQKNIEEIVRRLTGLIGRVLGVLNPSPETSKEIVNGIEEAALEYWTGCGFLDDCDEETRAHIIGLVHHLVGLQTKLQITAIRRGLLAPVEPPRDPSQPSSLLEAQMNSRIEYSPQDLQNLRGRAAPCPEVIKTTACLLHPKSPVVKKPRGIHDAKSEALTHGLHDITNTPKKATDSTVKAEYKVGKPSEQAKEQILGVASQRDWLAGSTKTKTVDSATVAEATKFIDAVKISGAAETFSTIKADPAKVANSSSTQAVEIADAIPETKPCMVTETKIAVMEQQKAPPTPPPQLDADLDTTMGNSIFGACTYPTPRPEATAKENRTSKTTTQGLGSSRWANPQARSFEPGVSTSTSEKFPTLAPGSGVPFLDCSNIVNASAPAGRSVARSGAKGLSASRYAQKPVAFQGFFTGAA